MLSPVAKRRRSAFLHFPSILFTAFGIAYAAPEHRFKQRELSRYQLRMAGYVAFRNRQRLTFR